MTGKEGGTREEDRERMVKLWPFNMSLRTYSLKYYPYNKPVAIL